MGRLRALLCPFCLEEGEKERAVGNQSTLGQNVDVSHLASPHISSETPTNNEQVTALNNSIPVDYGHSNQNDGDDSSTSNGTSDEEESQSREEASKSSAIKNQTKPVNDGKNPLRVNPSINNSNFQYQQQSQRTNQTPPASSSSVPPPNFYESPSTSYARPAAQQQQSVNQPLLHPEPAPAGGVDLTGEPVPRLSYDIISVREPLAKVLAERNQQQQQKPQQQSRQTTGDHDYIEVYGERGSSCFYEEIAGSTTSSATYDQIDGNSNHNYQVLTNNAYVVPNKNPGLSRQNNNNRTDNRVQPSLSADTTDGDNANDGFNFRSNQANDNSNGPNCSSHVEKIPSSNTATNGQQTRIHQVDSSAQPKTSPPSIPTTSQGLNMQPSQSIPVYSVINKATKSRANGKSNPMESRPPQPPPKNPNMVHQPSTSKSIPTYEEPNILFFSKASSSNHNNISWSRNNQDFPFNQSQAGSLNANNNIDPSSIYNLNPTPDDDHVNGLPKPPPRSRKGTLSSTSASRGTSNATNRPLPSPDSIDHLNNNNSSVSNRNLRQRTTIDCDLEADSDNGYEFLVGSNFDDDQIDVGYEKIRESTRQGCEATGTGRFCPMPVLDNDGYESLQPIYASPSSTLAEPNYEAIGPSTASELAASAAAKLTAAAAIIEQTNP